MNTIKPFESNDIFYSMVIRCGPFNLSDLLLFNRFIEDSLNFDILDSYNKLALDFDLDNVYTRVLGDSASTIENLMNLL